MTATGEICRGFFNLEIGDEIHERTIERLHDLILKYKRNKASKYYLIVQKIKREIKSNPTFQGIVDLLENLFGTIKSEQNKKFDIVQMFLITEILLEYSSKYVSSADYSKLKDIAPSILSDAIQCKYRLNATEWMMITNDWVEDFSCFVQNVTVIGLVLYSLHHLMK